VHMGPRSILAVLVCTVTLLAPAGAQATDSAGTHEQIAWVRRAARNFVTAELAGNGAGACAILNAPMRATEHHRACAQRWDARLTRLLHEPGGRSGLRTELHAIAAATVRVHGNVATIALPAALLDGPNRFLWTENCWMLES
jgi:hypothetical protein